MGSIEKTADLVLEVLQYRTDRLQNVHRW